METNVKIINRSKHPLPAYETPQSAGMDIRANLDAPIVLKPMQRVLVPTGLYIELPAGYEAQMRPRSGLALKYHIAKHTRNDRCRLSGRNRRDSYQSFR